MRTHGLLCALFLAGCGGAPPPAAPAGPATLGERAPATMTPLALPPPVKTLDVLSAAALPDRDAFESAVAIAGLTASVGLVQGGLALDEGGVHCDVSQGARPSDVPDPRIAPEVQAQGLDADDAAKLAAATGAASVTCRNTKEVPPVQVVPVAEAVADALVKLTGGVVHDPQTGRYWPTDAWKQSREKRRAFDVRRSVAVERGDPRAERTWIATRGMAAFGRPDLALYPVRAADADALADKLLVIADDLISRDPVGDGSRIDVGPTKVLLWSDASYAATLPADAPRPPAAANRLALVDPAAKPGDAAGLDHLAARLIRQ